MFWKGSLTWLLIAALAVANGIFRESVLRRWLSERMAHLVSTLLLSTVVFIVSFLTVRWIGVRTLESSWRLSVCWLAATLSFEFLAGHYIFGNSWEKIFADYNAKKARVWVLVPVCVLFAPPMAVHGLERQWALPYTVSLFLAVSTLILAFQKPTAARWIVVVLFAYAGCYNTWIGMTRPQEYLHFADFVLVPAYREFILGPFGAIAGPMILAIAFGQILSAAALALGNRWKWAGTAGVCLFLLAIAPFGFGSAFPLSVLGSFAIVIACANEESRSITAKQQTT